MIRNFLLTKAQAIMASRPPDFSIGPKGDRYMLRWWVIPRNRWFNIYLHRFLHDDEDRALHDHPWVSCSYILWGNYIEHLANGVCLRREGSLTFRWATTAHRISLIRDEVTPISLFVTGPVVRVWGFHCPKGWIPWNIFTDTTDKGSIGRGCE
jgi:hypothetical protein